MAFLGMQGIPLHHTERHLTKPAMALPSSSSSTNAMCDTRLAEPTLSLWLCGTAPLQVIISDDGLLLMDLLLTAQIDCKVGGGVWRGGG